MVAAAGCSMPNAKGNRDMSTAQPPDEIEIHIGFLLQPFGGSADVRRREASITYLLAHADRAYPRLIALLQANPTALNAPRIIAALPRFARADSVPLLESILLRGAELASEAAGQALGLHPDPSAAAALSRALQSTSVITVNAAADGLLLRGGPLEACRGLLSLAAHPDSNVRYHAIRAAARLGCLNKAALTRWADDDPDVNVRNLARELLSH